MTTCSSSSARVDTKVVMRGLQSLHWKPRMMLVGANVTSDITGVTPPISFARKRHIGSTGAHILAVDPKARAFVTVRPASDPARQ